MKRPNDSIEERILLLAPTGGDSANAISILRTAGFEGIVCSDLDDVVARAREGVGAILLAEEALRIGPLKDLIEFVERQPSWSDVPLVVITSGGDTTHISIRAYEAFGPNANLSLVERPFRVITLISTLRAALRSRRRQYEVRDLLEQLEEKVRERTARLEQTISELEAFSYSMSHDLRAPLRAMRGYSQVLMDEYSAGLDEEGQNYLKRILTASERLDRLVQDVLRYSRCARETIDCVPVDLEGVLAAVIAEYPALRPPNAEIMVARPLLKVSGHEASLTQVISNLLGNAVKFVRPGHTPSVKIWTEQQGAKVRVFIRDNGIGIPPEHHDKVFKMFERLSAGPEYEGTGIGLAIVAKAVERMGGRVGIESQVGVGSTFWIELGTCDQ
ncbi:MAG TPA: ATP-binding protein [Verrucomicrobiae bacterium]|nr:ATP-binding protein [Verrucomicrobiae bacterium]